MEITRGIMVERGLRETLSRTTTCRQLHASPNWQEPGLDSHGAHPDDESLRGQRHQSHAVDDYWAQVATIHFSGITS